MEMAEPAFLSITVILTVLSAILVCGLVVSIVLYKRHVAGSYPKVSSY